MPSKMIELEIPRAGVWGMNTSASGDVMPKEYSVKAQNFVFSEEGYIEARRGSRQQHSDTLQTIASAVGAQNVRQIFQTVDEAGDDLTIFSTENHIYKIAVSTVTLLTGTMTAPTAGNWKFVNLNNEIFGFQAGHIACKLGTPSTGTFADMAMTAGASNSPVNTTSSTVQDVISGFGRLWVLEGDSLLYSSTLVPEDFRTASENLGSDGGKFTLASTYLNGKDIPTALAEFNGNLLVLAREHITVWANPWNPNDSGANYGNGQVTTTATDTAPMQTVETIGGVGCIARDSVQYTNNDILFLSADGIVALSRVIQEKSMPINTQSQNINREVLKLIRESSPADIWSAYLEGRGVYLFGSGATGCEESYLLDVSQPLPDGTYRATTWQKCFNTVGVLPQSALTGNESPWDVLYLAEDENYLSRVNNYQDGQSLSGGDGNSYLVVYESAWTPIDEELSENIKIPKKIGVVLKGSGAQMFDINLAFDYGDFVDSKAKTGSAILSSPSRYGVATYGGTTEDSTTAYYGAATSIKSTNLMGFGSGRIMKIKLTATVDGSAISLQRLSINSKIGRHI